LSVLKSTIRWLLNQKQVYEMERNNLGMMYQYGLEVGLIQINKADKRRY